MITMAIRILYQNEAEKSKSGDNDFFLLTNQICLYVGVALDNEIYYYVFRYTKNSIDEQYN